MSRVSVGLPVYNGEKYLEKAINSILKQTFEDFELIISDNASTDKTVAICNDLASEDKRIRYFRNEENLGAAWNYNRVFYLAKNAFFKWAAADDLIETSFLEHCLKVLKQNDDVVLCYPYTVNIDEWGNRTEKYDDQCNLLDQNPSERFKKFLLRSAQRCNPVFGLIRTSALRNTALIGNYNASDEVLLGHLSLLGKFYAIPDELFFRRHHPGMSMQSNTTAQDVKAWFDPQKKDSRVVLPISRKYLEYIRCLMRTNLGINVKVYCLKEIFRKIWWTRKYIKDEIVYNAKNILG